MAGRVVQLDKNASSNGLGALVSLKESVSDTIDFWAEAYFRLEVTTSLGKYLMEKTGNVAAVQKQLGHKNAAYSMQYAQITGDELLEALDGR